MRKIFLVVAMVMAGCGGETLVNDVVADTSSPLVGCWATSDGAGDSFALDLRDDMTCEYTTVKASGKIAAAPCDYVAADGNLTINYTLGAGAQGTPMAYAVSNGVLTVGSTSWTASACN